MASNYPGTLDTYTNPVGTNTLDAPDHAAQHANINDSMLQVQATLGTTAGTALFNAFGASDKPEKKGVITIGTTPYTTSGTLAADYYLKYNGTNIIGGTVASGGVQFWSTVPGTPTRLADATVAITDTGGTLNYQYLFNRDIVLKWLNGGTTQLAKIESISTAANTVTWTIVGNAYGTGGSSLQYGLLPAMREDFLIAGNASTGAVTNMSKPWYAPFPINLISADLMVESTAVGSGTYTFDVVRNGTSVFTTLPAVTTGTADFGNAVTSPTTSVPANDKFTINQTTGGTSAPTDITVRQWYIPTSWLYKT